MLRPEAAVGEIDYETETTRNCFNVLFFGKSGYGKSTLLNNIFQKKVFKTDDVEPCTYQVESAEVILNKNYSVSFCDFPGIGETANQDKRYRDMYKYFMFKAHCIVYTFRADMRDFVNDEKLFSTFSDSDRSKLVGVVNFVDKIEPITRKNSLSARQKENLSQKITQIIYMFSIQRKEVIPVCGRTSKNTYRMVRAINKKICS